MDAAPSVDGAAALLISARAHAASRPALAIESFVSALAPEGASDMAWEIGNHGFDIRSTFYQAGALEDIRYIEVKARARSGAIRLSSNEWKKARHFASKFWLYIITDAGTEAPQIHCLQNPAAKFEEGEDIYATGGLPDGCVHACQSERHRLGQIQ